MFEWYAARRPAPTGTFGPHTHDLEEALGHKILKRSNIVWQEHCSECAMPSCYSTCDFYRPRHDFKCRRFDVGAELLEATEWTAAPMRIRFGKWAGLLGYGPAPLVPVDRAVSHERSTLKRVRNLDRLPLTRGLDAPIRRRMTNRLVQLADWRHVDVSRLHVLIETFVEGDEEIALVFSAREMETREGARGELFRTRIDLPAGYSAQTIPLSSFVAGDSVGPKFSMQFTPASEEARPEVLFGVLDVVELEPIRRAAPVGTTAPLGPLKCVIWDLDHTVWDGILIEDGLEKLSLRPGVVETIQALDERGVLHSVASKNTEPDAMEALEHFGIADYFLAPQISWGPKSEGVHAIAQRLSLATDSFAFIDDQPFERAEVEAVHPNVLVLDIDAIDGLLDNERLQGPVTAESRKRRSMYRAEIEREVAMSTAEVDYDAFLKSCEMQVKIEALRPPDVQRVHELVQRTNQLNLSTTRYTRDQVEEFASRTSSLASFTVRAEDRFGEYGLVGFCVVDPERSLILDMMFSCRVQSKLVDDSFVEWLATEWLPGVGPLRAKFKPSERNSPARGLLERTGFEPADEADGIQIFEKTRSPRSFAELGEIVSIATPVSSG